LNYICINNGKIEEFREFQHMIYLFHGDNIELSRAEYNQIKIKMSDKNIRILPGKALDLALITQALESQSLFGGETVVFIDNLFSPIGKKIKLIQQYAQIIKDASENNLDIVLWEEKEMGKTVMTGLGNHIVNRLFKLPVLIFTFLDNFKPGNSQLLINEFSKLRQTDAAELLFSMIVRRFRQLIMLRDSVIPEGLQSWQAARLTTQSKYFSIDELVSDYKKLIEIEYLIKSGMSPLILDKQLELFIINL
jgi:hypothetical protein